MTAPASVDTTTEHAAPVHRDNGVPVGTPSALWMLIAGIVGLALSADLTIEKITMLGNTDYRPTCSINPILSCGSVMRTWQASVFGFPNPLIGICAFTVILVTAVLAIGKVQLPRWYWVGAMIGTGLGVIMIHWLIFQTLYRIGALCPYCMVVWSVTIPLFVVLTSVALRPASGGVVARTLHTWRWSIVALWFTTVVLLILIRFWDYWSTLI